jgi:hypothetical protein
MTAKDLAETEILDTSVFEWLSLYRPGWFLHSIPGESFSSTTRIHVCTCLYPYGQTV